MSKFREYSSDQITILYDLRRCIHAKECVSGLPSVFDPERRPWIDPEGAAVEEIIEVIYRCPTGALRYHCTDGRSEPEPQEAEARVVRDGPLYVRDGPLYVSGKITVADHEGNVVIQDRRIALCRCGASKNKPFCDNSHLESGFTDDDG